MKSYIGYYILLGFIFGLLLLLLLQSYWSYKKKTAGFPFYNLLPYLLYCQATNKVSKDAPFSHVLFEELVKLGKRHIKEGLFMTYFNQPILFIYSEDVIKIFANEKAALDKSPEYKMLTDTLGAGLITSNGERWRRHRKLINPAFNMGILKQKVPLFNEHANVLVKDLEKFVGKPSVDILDTLKVHYFSTLCESVLGLKLDEKSKQQFKKIGEYADNLTAVTVERIFYPWLRPKLLLSLFPFGRTYLQQEKECGEFINNTLSNMKKYIFSLNSNDEIYFGNHVRKSFSYLLLNHHIKYPDSITIEDLRHETRTILGAGYDTVTFSTMWCLFLLGMHPDIQEKAFKEIQLITSDYITYEESCDLVYLEAVIMESLRLYPTVPMYFRNLSEDVQCGKYKVLKGTSIAFFPYLSHKDPEMYPDPEKFDPERLLNAESKKTWHLIPFSEGSRSCIGKKYALLEMKISLSHILRNFKITSLDRREDIKLCWTIILSPAKHLRFKITRRHNI